MSNIDLANKVGTASNRIATNEMRLNEERIRLEKKNKELEDRIDKAIEELKIVQKDLEEAEWCYYDWLDKSIQILRGEDNE